MKSCVIFGGAGFIGTHLARHFLTTRRFDHIHIADIRKSPLIGNSGISFSNTDVCDPIDHKLFDSSPEWIFNLAAIHREPGHQPDEYFETNLNGARNVCAYADQVNCDNMFFTSSIAVYGPTNGPTDEKSPIRPTTPYGGSKYPAELIHDGWRKAKTDRRLIITRPGVVYGPGDPGNIMRLMRAIRKGYFAFPGNPSIFKSYAYIYGLIDSIEFFMNRTEPLTIYNYAETPTQPLKRLVSDIKSFFDCKAIVVPLPLWLLLPIARVVQMFLGFKNPIHPVRVKKAATSTHIIPGVLKELGFDFKYDFINSLKHWQKVSPADFDMAAKMQTTPAKIHLIRKGEESTVTEPYMDRIKSDYKEPANDSETISTH